MRRHLRGILGAMVLLGVVAMALAAPWLSPQDPLEVNLRSRLGAPVWSEGGSSANLLGTDQLGRDLLSRMIWGSRISLLVGVASVLVSGLIGMALGMISGYAGGWLDQVIMRIVDVQMGFPFILMAVTIMAFLGPSMRNLILVLVLSTWVIYCRLIRVRTLALREALFVDAARAIGCTPFRILIRHILPNHVPVMIVVGTFQLGRMIVAESALSFLGLGVPPPTPTWGGIISSGRMYIDLAWWIVTFPGALLTITVIAVGSVGDWLRRVLDPRLRRIA